MPVRSVRGAAASRSLPDSPDLAAARGKGGCWTCRLRRKKCDEQRDNGSCQTCIRLKIECLGWGIRRPDWMRDKAQVEAYKAGIKRQLSSQGMIRGQPRAHPGSTTMSPGQYQYPITRTTRHGDPGSDETDEYAYDQSGSANTSPSYPPIQMPQLTPDLSASISALDLHLYPPAGPHTPPVLPSSFTTPSPHVIESDLGTILPFVPSHSYYEQTAHLSASASSPESREHYVLYYFRRVRQIQFLFAGPSVTSVFHDLVIREPVGVVTNAICALAALHKSQMRVAEGLENPTAENSLYSLSRQYYDQAWWQLLDSRQRHHRYMEQDATAAIHLVSYWIFCGGGGEWQLPLNVASDWLAECPLNSVANPRLQWLQLSPSARFTTQMTMWLDIISAIGMQRVPRFMNLYRRLFRADQQNYWPGSPQDGQVQNLHMDALTGCPDGVMYALAETANLAHWKMQHQQSHRLSVRELLQRSDTIEHDLRATWVTASPEVFPHLLDQHYDINAPPSTGTASSSAHPSPIHPTVDLVGASSVLSTPEPVIGGETRRLVANVFFEAAVLLLQSVVNDHNPAVPEIMEGVNATMQALNKLALSEVDRGLVFPICVAGCLTNVREQRLFFKQRLDAQDTSLGNLSQTRRLMEVVWRKRDSQGGVVDWRNTMPDIGVDLLV
ncbi:fungal-specific transcription factor domain-containing protein, partial [Gautieria morchelliformis]